MLRISVRDENETTSLSIEGKLTAAGAVELEKCWLALIERQPSRSIVVRLAAVTFMDIESRELLIRMRRQGVRLVPTGCLMKVLVDQIEAEVKKEQFAARTGT
jgi:anti-anti-sigma regulatory factor